jgi:plastocyanin
VRTDTPLGRLRTWVIVLLVPAIAGIAILVTAGVSGDWSSAPPGSVPADTVDIKNFSFSPNPITVKAGHTITVVNDDGVTHTLTANGGAFDTGNLSSGKRGHVTVARTGSYAYHCEIHPFMRATVEIAP